MGEMMAHKSECRVMGLGVSLAVVAAGLLSACDSQMITTSNFYPSQIVTGNDATDGKKYAQAPGVIPVHGIPYYLPQSVLHLTVAGSYPKDEADKYQLTVKLNGIEQAPDPSRLYLLEYHTEDGTDDVLTIGINAKGLLSTAVGISTDRSGDILKKVAETFAKVAEGIPKGPAPAIAAANYCKELNAFTMEWTQPIAGAGEISIDDLGKAIFEAMTGETLPKDDPAKKAPVVTLKVEDEAEGLRSDDLDAEGAKRWPPKENPENWAPGLRFRVPKVAKLSMNFLASKFEYKGCKIPAIDQYAKGLPILYLDKSRDYVFDMSRSVLVHKEITLTINDGVLLGAVIKRDSPALAAVTLPLDLINILLSPITTLIHGPTVPEAGTKAGG
jgi:hypothetical protein